MKELIRHKLQHDFKRIKTSAKWVLFSIVSGLLVGGVGTLFYFGMYVVTLTRTKTRGLFSAPGEWYPDRRMLPPAS